jgi:hypothetical protein
LREFNISEEHAITLLRAEVYAKQDTSRRRQQAELNLPPASAAPLLTLLFNPEAGCDMFL